MNRIQRIAEAIRQNDFQKYQEIRYPQIPDGETIVFDNENFSGVDFANFCLTFFTFNNCRLNKSKNINGFTITINNCSAQEIEFGDSFSVIYAKNSDFSDMKYCKQTLLADVKNLNDYSIFTSCTVDPETIKHFTLQGVKFS